MKRKIYLCPKCGRALNFSDNSEYTFQCLDCDEDFYSFEAKEVEQPRMEGVKDYTQLVEASMKVKEITDSAIGESQRYITLKGQDILEQIAEYINAELAGNYPIDDILSRFTAPGLHSPDECISTLRRLIDNSSVPQHSN